MSCALFACRSILSLSPHFSSIPSFHNFLTVAFNLFYFDCTEYHLWLFNAEKCYWNLEPMMQLVIPPYLCLVYFFVRQSILILNTHFSSIPASPFLRNYCFLTIARVLLCFDCTDCHLWLCKADKRCWTLECNDAACYAAYSCPVQSMYVKAFLY